VTIQINIMNAAGVGGKQAHAYPVTPGTASHAGQGVYLDPGETGVLYVHEHQHVYISEVVPETAAG
jgi:hypothetical protein